MFVRDRSQTAANAFPDLQPKRYLSSLAPPALLKVAIVQSINLGTTVQASTASTVDANNRVRRVCALDQLFDRFRFEETTTATPFRISTTSRRNGCILPTEPMTNRNAESHFAAIKVFSRVVTDAKLSSARYLVVNPRSFSFPASSRQIRSHDDRETANELRAILPSWRCRL